MCGIVAYTGKQTATPFLIDGLKKLEYRGYDSAGIALQGEEFEVFKNSGNISRLEDILPAKVEGSCGIAHTRWATHGKPTADNAHPHVANSGKFVLVHNGIIENYQELKDHLVSKGFTFKSETDTEVFMNQIDFEYQSSTSVLEAIQKTLSKVEGSYAFALICNFEEGKIYSGRKNSPLVVGTKDEDYFIGSDAIALGNKIDTIYYPEDGELAILSKENGVLFLNKEGNEIEVKKETVYESEENEIDKSIFEDFMLKEVFDQPGSIEKSFQNPMNENTPVSIAPIQKLFNDTQRIVILGCGTSWHAGLIGKFLIEKMARIPVEVEYASEYRYRSPVIRTNDLIISISQSGETADTLAATRLAIECGAKTMALCNVNHSSLTRETDYTLLLNAGVEIGVASTKAFTNQVSVLTQLAVFLAKEHNNSYPNLAEIETELQHLPQLLNKLLEKTDEIKTLASQYSLADNFLFIGRGINYPIAMEGALKLKEISYIHAEGYPGAEMKHGPIALIDWAFPTFAIVTDKQNQSKMVSNIQEIQARNGKVIAICRENDLATQSIADEFITVPDTLDELIPILSVVPCQLFSYYLAKMRGCNVDQPRNLAKSVTVE